MADVGTCAVCRRSRWVVLEWMGYGMIAGLCVGLVVVLAGLVRAGR